MMEKKIMGKKYIFCLALLIICLGCVTGCSRRNSEESDAAAISEADNQSQLSETSKESEGEPANSASVEETTKKDDSEADDAGNTTGDEVLNEINIENKGDDNSIDENSSQEEQEPQKKVDLIVFSGQSNMSGCGGDASLAPKVSEEAGGEFRAISDPTRLYPITEPFGINENNINGLLEKPGGKKGSMVSAFINEYHEKTGNYVVAVSASRGETAMSQWLEEPVQTDVLTRFIMAKQWLESNDYVIEHMYMVWLQGESDALKNLSADAYKTNLDDFIRPLFMGGLQKVFIVTPGRTIDSNGIYNTIINAQLDICKNSGYYALATSVLSGVSTEYMVDIYHYNQHVLNMVGVLSADSAAYYTVNNKEMTLYDYKNKGLFIPEGGEEKLIDDSLLDLSAIDINEIY